MTTHVLVPVDGSPQSKAALDRAIDLFPDERITLLHVVDPIGNGDEMPASSEEWVDAQREVAERVFESTRESVDEDGARVETAIEAGSPWRAIVEYVDENDVDHVMMGSHGRDGATRLLLGSVAELVVRRSDVPVTVVK